MIQQKKLLFRNRTTYVFFFVEICVAVFYIKTFWSFLNSFLNILFDILSLLNLSLFNIIFHIEFEKVFNSKSS
jgi:hypothetical protein